MTSTSMIDDSTSSSDGIYDLVQLTLYLIKALES